MLLRTDLIEQLFNCLFIREYNSRPSKEFQIPDEGIPNSRLRNYKFQIDKLQILDGCILNSSCK